MFGRVLNLLQLKVSKLEERCAVGDFFRNSSLLPSFEEERCSSMINPSERRNLTLSLPRTRSFPTFQEILIPNVIQLCLFVSSPPMYVKFFSPRVMGAHGGGSKSISLVTSRLLCARASISLVHFDRSLAVAQGPAMCWHSH